jgi:hypothetical protein
MPIGEQNISDSDVITQCFPWLAEHVVAPVLDLGHTNIATLCHVYRERERAGIHNQPYLPLCIPCKPIKSLLNNKRKRIE